MSLIRSCGALGSAARKVAHHFAISQSASSRQAGVAATITLPSLCSSQACKPFAGDLVAHQGICWRAFSSSPIQPNPLGSTNPSGAGIDPVGSHSAPDSESSKPNPLAATTAVTMDGPGKPGTARDSSAPTSGTSEKPDPLTATTNVKPDTTGAATSSSSFQQSTYDGPPKLIVFGGNGFVGTRVCEEALQTGLAVVSINRSGPPKATAAWTSDVEWVSADALEPEQWREQLQGAVGVVSCLGAFGSNEFMLKICGEANVGIIREAAKAAVPRCAFISIHDYNFPGRSNSRWSCLLSVWVRHSCCRLLVSTCSTCPATSQSSQSSSSGCCDWQATAEVTAWLCSEHPIEKACHQLTRVTVTLSANARPHVLMLQCWRYR
ncbi:hypothetical protein ABBQ38_007628 [Trebouxia sp. C0009 RCD-2024]